MGKNWAIAIGINRYENLSSLKYAKRDAEAMAAWFGQEAKFEEVFLFTGTFQEQNKRKLYPERLAAILKASFTGYNHSEAYLKCVLKRSASQCLRQRTYLLIISRSRSGCFADREYRSILYMATSI